MVHKTPPNMASSTLLELGLPLDEGHLGPAPLSRRPRTSLGCQRAIATTICGLTLSDLALPTSVRILGRLTRLSGQVLIIARLNRSLLAYTGVPLLVVCNGDEAG